MGSGGLGGIDLADINVVALDIHNNTTSTIVTKIWNDTTDSTVPNTTPTGALIATLTSAPVTMSTLTLTKPPIPHYTTLYPLPGDHWKKVGMKQTTNCKDTDIAKTPMHGEKALEVHVCNAYSAKI